MPRRAKAALIRTILRQRLSCLPGFRPAVSRITFFRREKGKFAALGTIYGTKSRFFVFGGLFSWHKFVMIQKKNKRSVFEEEPMKMNRIGTMRMVENRMVDPQALAVHYGVPQQLADRKKTEKAAYAETERRLYAMRALRARVEDAREELAELEGLGVEALREHSASLVRVLRPGMRLDPEEVHTMQLAMLRGRLAADERELKRMNIALSFISDDPYYLTVEARYLRGVGDVDIAERLNCDPSTVRRNRIRLVRMLALRLYGMGGGACGSSF